MTGTNRPTDPKTPRPSGTDAAANIEIDVTGYEPRQGPSGESVSCHSGALRRGGPGRALLRVCVIVGVSSLVLVGGCMFVMNSILRAIEDSTKTCDGDNLKGLMKAYLAGQSDQKVTPTSVGHLFWIALITGDDALDPQDAYLTPGDAGLLVAPRDPVGNESEAIGILKAAKAARDPSQAVYPSGQTIACYGGPRAGVMRGASDISDKVVGCTGQRNGVTFYEHSFNVVWGNVRAETLDFDKLEADPAWGGGWAAVQAGGPVNAAAKGFTVGPMQWIDPITFPN